ncbi:MAG: aminoacyl-tRNA hydrolase [Alphaproteobacteria bacterium]
MKLVVGLGNPGPQYLTTRHNAGFLLLDYLQDYYKIPPFKAKFQGGVSLGEIESQEVVFLKPLTFMNLSGQSVQMAAHFYKILPQNIFVCHDEIDISFGAVKVKQGGGNGGHKGLKSIEASLGTQEFWRLRLGVGRPSSSQDATQHVLANFSKHEQEELSSLYDKISCFFPLFLKEKPQEFIEKIGV